MTELKAIKDVGFTVGERIGTKLALHPEFPYFVNLIHALKNIANIEGMERELKIFGYNNRSMKGE